jgi:DNA sulfur modification protein DndD
LIISRLKAKNFAVYSPSLDIQFKAKREKHLWVFEGLTGNGKTTLFLTFIWGLYGDEGLEFHTRLRAGGPKKAIDMVSRQAIKNGDSHMSVEIHFEHDGRKYILQRFVQPKKTIIQYSSDYVELVRLKDELGRELDLPNERVREILPLEASQFFFFAGEVLQKYAEPTSSDTRNAIEKVLGFPEIRSAINDVRYYQKELTASIRENEASTSAIRTETQGLEMLQDDIERLTKEIGERRTRLAAVVDKIPELEAQLRGFEEVRELQLKSEDRQHRKEFLEEEEKRLRDDKYDRIRRLSFLIARKYLRNSFDTFREQSDLDAAELGIRKTEPLVRAIESLQKSERCWCGNPIHTSERNNLHKIQEIYEKQLSSFVEKSKNRTTPSIEELSHAMGFLNGLDADYGRIDRELAKIRVEIGDIDSEIETIDKKIQDVPVQKVRITKDQLDKSNEMKGSLASEISERIRMLDRDNRAKEDTKRRIATIQIESKAVDAWRTKLTGAGQVIDALEYVLAKLISEKRRVIESEASKALKAMAAREITWDKITISDDYTVELHNNRGEVIPRASLSDGQKEILALSFIEGLKNASENSAPVVIDYLLGRLDTKYQDNMANELPNLGEQVIYLVLNSELTDERRRTLERECCAWFTIEKDPKTELSEIVARV